MINILQILSKNKVDDTTGGIKAGLYGGMWTVGIAKTVSSTLYTTILIVRKWKYPETKKKILMAIGDNPTFDVDFL